ncbi:MAG: DUF72 domain-containing protein [Gemmatimonadetes bacterium]|nr:DUF72 domain-containing protein [Gemmatimonadota bacterium]
MRVHVGTSGFAYGEWKGSFYPEDLPASAMLRFYAERFRTVEMNNTFYRMPSEKTLLQWKSQVPDGFTFVLKASQRITHFRRLKDAADPLAYLLATSAALGAARGPFLFQLPPNLQKDLSRLETFLDLLDDSARAAFEFRHPSWHDEDVHAALRARGVALCVADTGEATTPVVATAAWGYLRLRRQEYDDAVLEHWARRAYESGWIEAFVFFKHEDAGAGPRLAARFEAIVADVSAA